MLIQLINNLTKTKYNFDNLTDNSQATDLFFCLDISLEPDMVDGEYTLILFDDGYEVFRGICQIGDYNPVNTTYNNNDQTIVYNG